MSVISWPGLNKPLFGLDLVTEESWMESILLELQLLLKVGLKTWRSLLRWRTNICSVNIYKKIKVNYFVKNINKLLIDFKKIKIIFLNILLEEVNKTDLYCQKSQTASPAHYSKYDSNSHTRVTKGICVNLFRSWYWSLRLQRTIDFNLNQLDTEIIMSKWIQKPV